MRKIIAACAFLLAAAPALAQQTPWAGSPQTLPGRIQGENYDRGGPGVAYFDTTAGNIFGTYRTDSMDVGPIPGGGYHLGYIHPGEWAEYTVSVPTTGNYVLEMRVATLYTGANTFRVLDNGVDVSGTQSVSYTGGWHNYIIKSVPVTLQAGTRVLRLAFDAGAWNLDWIDVRGQAPYTGSPITFPGRLQAERYDQGGEGIAYHDTSVGNVFNTFRTDSMDVGAIPGGGFHLGFLDTGEWAEYTVNVTQSGSYELRMRFASAFTGTKRFRVLVDGFDVSGAQTLAYTGDWHAYQTKVVPVSLQAGVRVLRLSFETGAWNLDFLDAVRVTCSAPTITSQPTSRTVNVGSNTTFIAGASGSPAPALQWLKNGVAISGATSSSFTLTNVQTSDAAGYRLRATNSCGTATSNTATLTVNVPAPPSCAGSPGRIEQALADVLNGQPPSCNWEADMLPSFPASMGGGSYNKPVLAAAIALIVDPVRNTGTKQWNAYTWWDDYLRGELGQRGNVWKYGGKELTSANYQHYNIAAVMAVHYQAWKTNRTTLQNQARAWLRATFAIHSMAAVPSKPKSFHDRGSNETFGGNYTGPYVALPGMRSSENHWGNINRSLLFARASGLATNLKGEAGYQRNVRTFLEANWSGPGGNVYGLDSTDRSHLRNVLSGTLSTRVTGMLGGISTVVPLQFAAWPGVRATAMDGNQNGNTAPTFGMVWFSAPRSGAGNEVHVLYPWTRWDPSNPNFRPFRKGPFGGYGRLELPQRRVRATNAPGSTTHPLSEPVVDSLPPGAPQFTYTLN